MADVSRGGIRRLLRDALGYGAGNIALRATSLALVPLYTRVLSPAEYGVLDLLTSAALVTTMVLTMGMDTAVWRFFYDADSDTERRRLVASALGTQIGVGAVLVLIMIPLAGTLGWLLTGQAHRGLEVMFAIAGTPLLVAMGTFNVILRTQFKILRFNIYAISQFALVAGFNIAAMHAFRPTAQTVLASTTAAYVVLFCVGVILIRHHISLEWSRDWAKHLLSFGLPLVPAAVGLWSLPLLGRYVVAHDLGLDAAATMTVAAKIAAVLALVFGSFQTAWGPFALSIMRRPDAPETYRRVLVYLMVGGASVAAFVSILGRPIISIIATSRYAGAAPLVFWLSVGSLFATAYYVTVMGATIAKRPSIISGSILIACATNAALALALTPIAGLEGAAFAAFVGQAVSAWLPVVMSRNIYRIPFGVGGWLLQLITCAGLAIVGSHTHLDSPFSDALLRLGLVAMLAAAFAMWLRSSDLLPVVTRGLGLRQASGRMG